MVGGHEYPHRSEGWGPLPIELIEPNTPLYRTHRLIHDPLYFSVADKANRYDDAHGRFGVCYTSLSAEGAFAEAFLRQPTGSFVDEHELKVRALSLLTARRSLRLVAFYGAGLKKMGITAAVTAGPVEIAQVWSAACFDHRDHPDGIIYRASRQ